MKLMIFIHIRRKSTVSVKRRTTAVNRNLASNSYNMYLANYPFVIAFQLVLFTIPESSRLLKFGIVSSLPIQCAYTACQFLIKPFPRISAALAIGLSMIMASGIQL